MRRYFFSGKISIVIETSSQTLRRNFSGCGGGHRTATSWLLRIQQNVHGLLAVDAAQCFDMVCMRHQAAQCWLRWHERKTYFLISYDAAHDLQPLKMTCSEHPAMPDAEAICSTEKRCATELQEADSKKGTQRDNANQQPSKVIQRAAQRAHDQCSAVGAAKDERCGPVILQSLASPDIPYHHPAIHKMLLPGHIPPLSFFNPQTRCIDTPFLQALTSCGPSPQNCVISAPETYRTPPPEAFEQPKPNPKCGLRSRT